MSYKLNISNSKSLFLIICQLFCILVMVVLLLPRVSLAATYYVDQNHPQALDSNPGTENLPWKTLKKATNVVQAGDTVIVKAGRYIDPSSVWYSSFSPVNSGTPLNPITFKSEPRYAAVLVPRDRLGPMPQAQTPAMAINERNYIIIDGFKSEGMLAVYGGNYNTIRNCEVIYGSQEGSDSSLNWGIQIRGNYNTVENNYVHNISNSGNQGDNTAGIMLFWPSSNNLIQNNLVDGSYNGNSGYINAAYGFKGGSTNNNTFRYNIAINAPVGFYGKGSTDGTEFADDNIFYQNIAKNCGSMFGFSHNCRRWKIYNNVAYNCGQFIGAWQSNNVKQEVWNNIAVTNSSVYNLEEVSPTIFFDYSDYNNLIGNPIAKYPWGSIYANNLIEWQSKTPFDDYSISINPLFVDVMGENFRLANNSPCINAGIDRQDYDKDGNTTERINMGAYITGNECIGVLENCQIQPDTTPPSPPKGLIVI